MTDFLLLSFPVFGLVALGWAATWRDFADADALRALSGFSFRFALPALVFRMIAGQPLGHTFNPLFYGGYLASGTFVFLLVFGLSYFFGRSALAAAGARASTATVSNLGFLGPPLMLAFFGARGTGPLAMAILAEVMVLLSLGGIIMGAANGTSARGRATILRGAILNPVVVAIVLGAAAASLGLKLPTPVERLVAFLGGSAGPTALFALGGTLALQRLDWTTVASAAGTTLAKMIVYPVVVWYVLACLLKLDPSWIQPGVLIASFPSAGSNYLVAQRYGADAERVSAAIVLSTVVSVLVVPATAWLVLH